MNFLAKLRTATAFVAITAPSLLDTYSAAAERSILRMPGFNEDFEAENPLLDPLIDSGDYLGDYYRVAQQPPRTGVTPLPPTDEEAVDLEQPAINQPPSPPPLTTTTPLPSLASNAPLPNRSNVRVASLSRLPYMIGDTGAGTCFAFGGLFDAELSHPTLGCSRLNVSENNSPLPTDRIYYSYRHFENATRTRVWQYETNFDLDVHTIGGERTFFDGMMSFEMRLPLENRLTSHPFTYDVEDPPIFTTLPPGFFPMGGGRRVELGNMSLLLKALLYADQELAISAGLGLTLPTAQDIEYFVTTDNTLVFPSVPGLEADSSVVLDIFASNETLYLAPYLAWAYQPKTRWYHQGFFQVEAAANPSSITVAGDGLQDYYFNGGFIGTGDWFTTFPTNRADLIYQTLMRLNLGFGYIMVDEPNADLLQQLAAILELHWTSTLNDATITSIPVLVDSGAVPLQTIEFGNALNRVDIVNMAMGVSARVGGWVLTNGITVPLGAADDERAFDFEYNLQVQKPF